MIFSLSCNVRMTVLWRCFLSPGLKKKIFILMLLSSHTIKFFSRLNELDMANQQYINEMTVEFEKCQAMEKIRIEFFVETIRDYLNYIDVSKDARYFC